MKAKDLAYYLGLKYAAEVREGTHGGYFVTHPDLDGCMAEGASLEEAMNNLAFSRELWIETRLKGGYDVPEPSRDDFSGKVSLRMPPSLHSQLAKLAAQQDISLNLLMNTVLAEYIGGVKSAPDISKTAQELKALAAEIKATIIASPGVSGSIRQGPRPRASTSRRA